MNFGDYDRDLWIVREDEPGMASLTSRVGLGTWNIPIKNLQSTLKDLDPSSVIQVLSGAKEDNQCSCSKTVYNLDANKFSLINRLSMFVLSGIVVSTQQK